VPRGLSPGADGDLRCFWATSAPEYIAYHDEEWGRPITDDRGLFERLSLEAFQSGLSWLTILRKREAFREAFDGFDIESVAGYGKRDVRRLLGEEAIVRNRAKIEAAIANAGAALRLREEDESLADLVWSHRPARRAEPRSRADIRATTEQSTALARELKRRGFRFVGPTTAYALMQACGVVNDHIKGCAVRDAVEKDRQKVLQEMQSL
jgi:DNA-3-methyladenine glycosylase I